VTEGALRPAAVVAEARTARKRIHQNTKHAYALRPGHVAGRHADCPAAQCDNSKKSLSDASRRLFWMTVEYGRVSSCTALQFRPRKFPRDGGHRRGNMPRTRTLHDTPAP
jgi:hypothetical protein